MKNRILIFVTALIMIGTHAYAGNGDLVVDGNLSIGTPSPSSYGNLTVVMPSASNQTGIVIKALNNSGGGSQPGLNFLNGSGTLLSTIYADNGTNYFAINHNGAERLRVTSSGNVGIGTPSPSSYGNLTVVMPSASNQTGIVIKALNNGGGGSQPGLNFLNGSGTLLSTIYADNGTNYFAINHNGAERLRITSLGNVGIGTTNPHLLDVAGYARLNGTIYPSDVRLKKNLQQISDPLNKVLSLSGLTYEWKTEEYKDKGFPEGRHYGVIAQEIEKVLPEVVNTGSDGTKAVAYTEIIPVLIEAIKEQQKIIEKQQQELSEIRSFVGRLSAAHSR